MQFGTNNPSENKNVKIIAIKIPGESKSNPNKENIKIEIPKSAIDSDILKSYGTVIETGTDILKLFTFESNIQELSAIAIKKNFFFRVSPITLDDVFVALVGTEGNSAYQD